MFDITQQYFESIVFWNLCHVIVYQLLCNSFMPPSARCVERNRERNRHIPQDYTGSESTPGMESIMSRQFDAADGRAETLCALMGRLLYKVRQRDTVPPIDYGNSKYRSFRGKARYIFLATR